MDKSIFLLLGGNKLNYGIVKKFQNKNCLVYVVDWNEKPQLTGDKHYRIDVKDWKKIIDILKKDGVLQNVIFAYSSIDVAVKSVAMINREIGLKTISDEGLKYSSSKSMMTKRWDECSLLNRISYKYDSYDDAIKTFNNDVNVIIKPDNAASSRGITIIPCGSDREELINAFMKAKEEATDGIVVVEEFVDGVEFTVDMLGDGNGNVCVYGISKKTHTKNTKSNKIAVKLHYNSIDNELQCKIADFGIKCYKALGFKYSLGHLEVILKKDGILTPVEIGARSSGFIASDLVDIVSGADYLGDLIKVQNGESVINGLHPQTEKSSMYFFYDFPNKSKIVKKLSLIDFCDSNIISRYYDRNNIQVGKEFTNIDNDNARWGYEIIEGPKMLMTSEYIGNIEKEMLHEMMEA